MYDLGDIEHIRDSWLVKDLGTAAVKAEPTDLERAVALFDLAVRTVSLNNAGDPELPQTVYDILVIGRGTAEDRAWLFGELLRQAGMDAVIVRPNAGADTTAKTSRCKTPAAKAADSKTADAKAAPTANKTPSGAEPRWLVGALVDKQVYLFDPTLGWPIPSPDDKGITPTVRQPATLAQAAAHDELLRKLDVSPEKKYPLKASDLKSMKVEIITSGRYSEPRIKRIESFLAGSRSVVVYTPLADVGARPGLRSRVENGGAGSWKKEDVSVWDYPDRQLAAVHHLGDQTKIVHDAFWLPFEGPVEFEFDPKTMQFKIAQGTTITSLKGGKPARPQAGAIPAPGEENDRVEAAGAALVHQHDVMLAADAVKGRALFHEGFGGSLSRPAGDEEQGIGFGFAGTGFQYCYMQADLLALRMGAIFRHHESRAAGLQVLRSIDRADLAFPEGRGSRGGVHRGSL